MTDLDERYGRRRRPSAARLPDGLQRATSPNRWIVIVAVVLTIGVIGFWAASTRFGGIATQDIRADTLRFDPTVAGQITIEYRITAPADTALACAIEAQSDRHAVIGWDIVEVPPVPAASQEVRTTVLVVGEATTVLVKECWRV